MAMHMLESVVTRSLAMHRMARDGSVVLPEAITQPSANLSHARRQQNTAPWRVGRTAWRGTKAASRSAVYDPRTSQAGRPECLAGVSTSSLALIAGRAVLSRRPRGCQPSAPFAGRSARRSNSWTTGFSKARLRAG